jgi:hypothetical protein
VNRAALFGPAFPTFSTLPPPAGAADDDRSANAYTAPNPAGSEDGGR